MTSETNPDDAVIERDEEIASLKLERRDNQRELLLLREKHMKLDAAFIALTKLLHVDHEFGNVARSVTDILDPISMPEDVLSACMTVIVYCRKRVGEQLETTRTARDIANG